MHVFHAAVIGRPVAHSLSPAIHTVAFAALEVEGDYRAIDVGSSDVVNMMGELRNGAINALSVTMPLKEKVIEYLDDLSDVARALGAVNCVSRDGDRLVGYNTDGDGCCDALEEQGGLVIDGADVLLLGAGGTARAVALGLVRRGAKVVVRNRTRSRAEALLEAVGAFTGPMSGTIDIDDDQDGSPKMSRTGRRFDAIVNTTSVGMGSDESPLTPGEIEPGTVVLDAVYSPLRTRLLKDAESAGATSVDGLWMLIHQARHQQLIWFGRACDPLLMRAESERVLAERSQ